MTKTSAPNSVEARVLDMAEGASQSTSVDVSAFGVSRRRRLLRSAVIRYQGNQRLGTHSTRTRKDGHRSERKIYAQKGTGRARHGDANAPIFVGGGKVFGPKPRSHRTDMPKKARREALRSALLGKFQDSEVVFLRPGKWAKPSTKTAAKALKELGVDGSAVIVLADNDSNLVRSFRNLPKVEVVPASDVNALHVLSRRFVVLVDDALDRIARRWTGA